jgi:hypothetical protein
MNKKKFVVDKHASFFAAASEMKKKSVVTLTQGCAQGLPQRGCRHHLQS